MKSAFSLVELSIVLVILGLLTGGILAGQSLIRAAELRSISTDLTRYTAASMAFRDKYFYLPGDMPNAFAFWGTVAGCTNTVKLTDPAGCNGNGDGRMQWWNSENLRAWQFMALSGLIEGSYTGMLDGTAATPGINVPASRLSRVGFYFHDTVISPATTQRKNAINFGGAIANTNANGPALRPEESWNLDGKMDDGNPEQGNFRSFPGLAADGVTASTLCTSGVSPNTVYQLEVRSVECRGSLFFAN